MAVLFNLDEFDDSRREFEAFFFSHFTLIEGHLLSLKAAVERSPCEVNVDDYIMEVCTLNIYISLDHECGNFWWSMFFYITKLGKSTWISLGSHDSTLPQDISARMFKQWGTWSALSLTSKIINAIVICFWAKNLMTIYHHSNPTSAYSDFMEISCSVYIMWFCRSIDPVLFMVHVQFLRSCDAE